MTHVPGSIRARLQDSTLHAWRLYCALELLIPYREATRNEQIRVKRQRLVASTIPWHNTAAGLTLELHTEVRRLEVHLKEQISGSLSRRRGGSANNTLCALQAISVLTDAVDDQNALSVLLVIDRWIHRAAAVLNPEKGLHRVPRAPGEGELRCPYCAFQTMRWHPATGIVVCINPECTTGDGVRPRWMAQFRTQGEELQLFWEPVGAAA